MFKRNESISNLIYQGLKVIIIFGIIFLNNPAFSKKKFSITEIQPLHFGTFCVTGSSGGNVIVNHNGNRTSTGNIILLNVAPFAQVGIYDILLCKNWDLSVTFDQTTILTGSNGGSITMEIGPSEYGISGTSFRMNGDCDYATPFHIGGTLKIPGNAISGNYSGTYDITVHKE